MIKPLRFLASSTGAVALLLSGPAWADDHAPPPAAETTAAATAAAAQTGPALWKVADDDTTIYLFGTVHALPPDVAWLKGDIASALGSSDTIVTEIILDDSMAGKMQQLVMSTGILPQGQTLRGLLDEEQRATYDAAMTRTGLPVQAFDQFEPWYAGMMLTMLPLLQQGYSPDAGVEQVLLKQAGEKDRGALETIEYQLGLFDQLPQDSQVRFLIETAEGIDQIKSMLDAMVAEWLAGDADALAKLMNEGLTDKVLAERLLYARNRNWAQWIDQRLDQPGTVFVAVGAGHLAGEQSVQDALGELGLTIHRVH